MDDSNTKSSFVSPSIVLNGTMEQVHWSGEDNFNNGHDQFFAWKKIERFFVCHRLQPFSKSPVSIWTVLFVYQLLGDYA